jgi:trk system potassium uptake protein
MADASAVTRSSVGPDLGPVAHVVAQVLIVLAAAMAIPAFVDWQAGNGNARAFLEAMGITGTISVAIALATRSSLRGAITNRQGYLLTFGIWTLVPAFAALPLVLGAPGLRYSLAYFEAVSGFTTTGATVIVGLDDMPLGVNLWRGMMNWLGGLGIAFVAMIFLPVMRVGGMQFFRTEGFDTLGKALPRAADIARALLAVYLALTILYIFCYSLLGMPFFEALTHGMATVATGGFSPRDSSFTDYSPAIQYAGALFMMMSSVTFILYVRIFQGDARSFFRDPQLLGFLSIAVIAVWSVTLWRTLTWDQGIEAAFRESWFNLASIFSGTGFFAGSFGGWEAPAIMVAFALGFIGGCSGSSSGGLSVFRVQLTFAALAAQIRLIQSPNRIARVRYGGRVVEQDVLEALAMFVTSYVLIVGVGAVVMTLMGVDTYSALMGSWQALGNIGYGFGPLVARTGTFVDFPDGAIWVMSVEMLLGRLGLLTMLVVLLPRFWRA